MYLPKYHCLSDDNFVNAKFHDFQLAPHSLIGVVVCSCALCVECTTHVIYTRGARAAACKTVHSATNHSNYVWHLVQFDSFLMDLRLVGLAWSVNI